MDSIKQNILFSYRIFFVSEESVIPEVICILSDCLNAEPWDATALNSRTAAQKITKMPFCKPCFPFVLPSALFSKPLCQEKAAKSHFVGDTLECDINLWRNQHI